MAKSFFFFFLMRFTELAWTVHHKLMCESTKTSAQIGGSTDARYVRATGGHGAKWLVLFDRKLGFFDSFPKITQGQATRPGAVEETKPGKGQSSLRYKHCQPIQEIDGNWRNWNQLL